MSIDVEVEILESSTFAGFLFLCWHLRWTFMVDMEFGRFFVINYSVRPGQYVKWVQFIAQSNVDLIGVKYVTCRKYAGSDLFF